VSELPAPAPSKASSDSVVCYCYNRTSQQLREAHARLGNLSDVQKETRAGTKCGGCRLVLESLFGENPDEILRLKGTGGDRNICARPGHLLMKGFVAADHRLDTVVYASNGAPPQFADQDLKMPVEYMLVDSSGRPVIHRSTVIGTNETFCFDTREENLPRPLYGMFLFRIGRANYGGARFNSVWTNGISACSTHEINDSGRPSVVLPIPVDAAFQRGPNSIHLAMQNPHDWPIRLLLQVFDASGREMDRRLQDMAPHTTRWLDVSKDVYAPILAAYPDRSLSMRIESDPVRMEFSPTLYFFLRNLNTDIWTANHL
jgi:bacterioferritin-associated ferredoxin